MKTPPKNHTLKYQWARYYQVDKGTWEDVCAHGIGHDENVHGCDGCCSVFKHLYQVKRKWRVEENKIINKIKLLIKNRQWL